MGTEFHFPDVGEGITEGKLISWKVKVGESVKTDQTLAEVETDKAVVEIPSPHDGVIEQLLASPGDILEVDKPFIIYEGGDSPAPEEKQETKEQPKEQVKEQQTSAPAPAPKETPSPAKEAPKQSTQTIPTQTTKKSSMEILATPKIRKLAREKGIDLSTVTGTGPHGRITEEDLSKPQTQGTSVDSKQSSATSIPSPKVENLTVDKRVEFTTIRKAIARNMTNSLAKTSQVTHSDEAEVSELVKVRKQEKDRVAKDGVKLTFLPFFMKAAVAALRKFPTFNALHDGDDAIILKKDVHIGLAVDAPDGLRVAVVKDVNKKSIVDIAKEIVELAEKTKQGKLTPKEMSGSTFTISSVGALGGTVFTPIINYPEVAILGISKIAKKPVVKDDKIVPGNILSLSLTFDHNVVDGAEAAKFVSAIVEYLEDPDLLLVESV